MVLAFVIAATAQLLDVGQRQQRIARQYSDVQTDLRSGLARLTRTLRHGYFVKNPSTKSAFADAPDSSASQVIVEVPQPAGAARIEVRCRLVSGTVYIQRSDESAPGTALMTGVQSLQVSYYKTLGTTQSSVDGTPQTASEVKIRLTGERGQAVTSVEALVALRNTLIGL